ncbi:MAG: chain-length determining protein, partial [Muribaculaceae bacterium]|nr:chain-length determining protein [Muribaculaceae bacterium]
MTQEEIKNEKPVEEEKEFDLLQMMSTLWSQRKKVFTWCFCGALLGLVVAFSLPKEYSVSVKLAPELPDSKTSGGSLSALASMAGLSGGATGGSDAVYPMLYPDVVSSVPFITGLFDVLVTTKDGETMTVEEFMKDKTTGPWWGVIFGLPGKIIGMFKSSDDENVPADHKLDNFQLTLKESKMYDALSKRISTSVDNKTYVVTIDVKMQDPRVSAILAAT